ncbi:MAG: Gfo/Idh/MocA family oxidoreductase [Deltaproteobacteria bacterium]|nr:Gfo/Idh/MocA family oxidoreductase [Deltaproteobacteria bacterium]
MMRLAIIGCGSIGKRHLANVLRLGYRNVLACDPVDTVRAAITAEFDVPVYSDAREVWAQRPDVTLINTPPHLHIPLAMQAAQVGSHVFIEKPLAHSLDQLEVLQGLVTAKRLITLVGCNMRFHPGPAQMKRLLDAGIVGQVLSARIQTGSYLPAWRPQQDYRQSYSASPVWGGAVLDCIHEVDLALWLLGEATLRAAVIRPATCLGLETDGLAELLLEHTGGAISNVHLNFVQRNYRRSIQIIGSTGTIEWDWTAACVDVYGPDGHLARHETHSPDWQTNQMYLDEMAHFLDCVQTRQPAINPLASAAQTLRIALAARRMR